MKDYATMTVGAIVAERPEAGALLEGLGIDCCCGRGKTLAEACAASGVNLPDLAARLDAARPAASAAPEDWGSRTPSELAEHIVGVHHTFLRRELPRLARLLDKVCGVHGERHPELLAIRETFRDLAAELDPHMDKEEAILFPYIVELDRAARRGGRPPAPFFGSVAHPIAMMEREHERAGAALDAIRDRSGGYALPEDACPSFHDLYAGLLALDGDLRRHIELESGVLFPGAERLEAR